MPRIRDNLRFLSVEVVSQTADLQASVEDLESEDEFSDVRIARIARTRSGGAVYEASGKIDFDALIQRLDEITD